MNRKGFTLIELLIVVVIIGILAAIAIPKFANTKEKAYLASMKSDLRNLITAEEAYFADSVKYTTALGTAFRYERWRRWPDRRPHGGWLDWVGQPHHDPEDLRDLRGFDGDRAGHQRRRADVQVSLRA